MNWIQIDIAGPAAIEEIGLAAMDACGCSNSQVIREEDLPEFDDAWAIQPVPRSRPDSRVTIRAYLPEGSDPTDSIRKFLSASGLVEAAAASIEITAISDDNWGKSWRRHHRPRRLGQRIVVVPSWARYRSRPGDLTIQLDPGMAFGTGQHATTRLCVAAIEKYLRPGDRVVDVGCGSGILALAAARLGAGAVTALDIDRIAVSSTVQAAKVNDVEILAHEGVLPESGIPADLVVANILAPVIVRMTPAVARSLESSEDGRFIASGLTIAQEAEVVSALETSGLEVMARSRRDGWSCLAARTARPPMRPEARS